MDTLPVPGSGTRLLAAGAVPAAAFDTFGHK